MEVVKKMLNYFYLLDYESDKDMDLYITGPDRAAHPTATDLAIDQVEGPQTRDKIMRLRQTFPHFGVQVCLEALIQKNLDYDGAVHSLIIKDTQGMLGEAMKVYLRQPTQGAEASSMYLQPCLSPSSVN